MAAARLPHGRGDGRPRRPARAAQGDRPLEGEGPRLLATSSTQPDVGPDWGRYCQDEQDHGIDRSLDVTTLLELCRPAIERGENVVAELPIRNVNRVVGTITGSEITRRYGAEGPAGGHHPPALQRLRRPELRRVHAAGHDAVARGRRQRLRRQGPLGRQDRRVPAARGDASRPRTTSSSATSRSTAPPAARPTSAAWRASASRPQQRRRTRSSRAWATTAAST